MATPARVTVYLPPALVALGQLAAQRQTLAQAALSFIPIKHLFGHDWPSTNAVSAVIASAFSLGVSASRTARHACSTTH